MSGAALLDLPFQHLPPEAEATFEGHRAFGYDLPTAIADLVDNSLTARARHIWIDCHWAGPDSTITVTDDGHGMSEEELVAAMRLSSRNPREARPAHDLGRFGLGLKTASLSHARRFTVRSRRTRRAAVTRCWDLEVVAAARDWRLLREGDATAGACCHRLAGLPHGTTVVWQVLDRLTAGTRTSDDADHQHFLRRIDEVRDHLAMVFHRQCGTPARTGGVRLLVNDHPVEPWDPFLDDEPATQPLAPTFLPCGAHRVAVQPFVLPHLSKLAPARQVSAAGLRGWNGHQGFYIYRAERLLVAGDWLGFWPRQDLYRLARIRIDLPNALDDAWHIDVTKSRAVPPPALRTELRRIGERTRAEARRIYTHRGAKLAPRDEAGRVLLWEPRVRHGKTFYRLNREHALVKAALRQAADRPALQALLRLVEESIPLGHITLAHSERPDHQPAPFEGTPAPRVREVLDQLYLAFRAGGRSHAEAVDCISLHPPCDQFPDLLAALAENPPHA